MNEEEFELDMDTIVDLRRKQQDKMRTEAHVVDGDAVGGDVVED